MKKFILTLLLFTIGLNVGIAQCPQQETKKVLLVGDSWAFFMGVDQTFDDVFNNWGMPQYTFLTNLTLAENGAQTDDFLQPEKQNEIINQLTQNPSIKFVHLSIGGNDLLNNWKSQSFTPQQTDSLVQATAQRLYQVIDFIKGVRPDIKVIWSGYCYPNFAEIINGFISPTNHPYYSNWEKMEFPTNQEINTQLNAFEDVVAAHYSNDSRVIFVKATGLMQYTFGQTDALGVAPYGTYPPKSVSLPEGKIKYPSPKDAMRDYGVAKDCFHLSAEGFRDLISYITQKFYFKAMMDDLYFVANDSLTTGSVTSDQTINNKLFVGNKNGTTYQTILSFDTKDSITQKVTKASIFLHRISHTGGDPVNSQILVTIKQGEIGDTAIIEPIDFNATGDDSAHPCLYGANTDGHWVRLDLPQNLLPYITKNAITQFKITAPNSSDALVLFSGTENPDFAPVLNISYHKPTTMDIEENHFSQPTVLVYPNPATSTLNITVDAVTSFKKAIICTIDGRKILESKTNKINIPLLPSGIYFVKVFTEKGIVTTQKFIKE